MKITSLVTGGAGFIGSHTVSHLLTKGHRVIVLDDLSGGKMDYVNPEAIFIQGSITDTPLVNQLFADYEIRYVYHLAAYAAEGLSHFIRKFNYQNNLIGSINLINASVNHGVECFVFTSSIAVYGTNNLPLTESQQPNPEDPYGIAKYAVEMDLQNAANMFGLDFVIFRPHNVYGVNQNIGDKYRNVVGIFMNQILQGKPLTIFGDGTQSRAFSYIDDVAPYIADSVNIAEARNKVINIGGGQVHTINQMAEAVSEAMGVALNVEKLPQRDEVEHAYADHTRFENIFNPQAYTTLKDGLQTMAAWVKTQEPQTGKAFKNIEIRKNLPPSWE